MKIQSTDITTEYEAAAKGTVWAIDRRWNTEKFGGSVFSMVTTTSWQQRHLYYVQAKYRSIISPSVQRIEVDVKPSDRPRLIWAGDPNDGTLTMLLSIVNGIAIKYGNKFSLVACCSSDPGPIAMNLVDKNTTKVRVSPSREELIAEMKSANVFAHPAMSFESFNAEVATAMSAGCLVLTPRHSGFLEMMGSHGFSSQHSIDNTAYGVAFASSLMEMMDMVTTSRYESYWTVAKKHADYMFSAEREEFLWKEFLGFVDFMENQNQ